MKQDNGITASHYQLPQGCTELQDLISFRNMNGQDAECFRALYRKGNSHHSSQARDTAKVLRYQLEELMRMQGTKANVINQYRVRLTSLVNEIIGEKK